ncbi:MAG: transcriptional activator NhaR [Gammaproteobacteria bacterium]|nr:transcriptional activator NhaR [Gammaproteobacteria bacterium]
MRTLNYNHLYYFWIVAREGTVARAAEILHLAPQTISGQLGEFEVRLDARLFTRDGRKLALTDTGRLVYDYADNIFRLGDELTDILKRGIQIKNQSLNIGIVDVLPDLITYRIVQPIFEFDNVSINCRTGRIDKLLADLSIHRLDFILSHSPFNTNGNIRAYNHHMGDSGITFFIAADLAKEYRDNFPACLDNAPLLLPTMNSPLRRTMEQWFRQSGITPYVYGEFDTSSLQHYIGESGAGVFVAPTVIKKQILRRYNVGTVADIASIKESYYLISPERRLKDPVATTIYNNARNSLFTKKGIDISRREVSEEV